MDFYTFSFSNLFVLFCSIKLRTIILQRGLADRSPAVSKECIKLMKDEWLIKCCNGDPVELLKYLDVETYELVGNAVMEALLKAGLVNLNDGESIRQYVSSKVDGMEGWLSFVVFLLN
jgi:condensin complex subunit 3